MVDVLLDSVRVNCEKRIIGSEIEVASTLVVNFVKSARLPPLHPILRPCITVSI